VTTKRAKTVAPLRPPERVIAREAVVPDDRGERIVLWLSLAWLVGFCLFFYSFTLPNNHVSRFLILFSLPDLLPVSDVFRASWGNLFQRADIFGVAIIVWAGAWGIGHLLLRAINPPLAVGRGQRGSAADENVSHPALERTFFAMALGLSAVPLLTLGLGLAGLLNRWLFISFFAAAIVAEIVLRFRRRPRSEEQKAAGPRPRILEIGPWTIAAIAAIVPFLIVMWLGSMSPDADFDVGTYHYEGPKEYFQNGRITYLPHNFYTNFPFLTEMFALLGMVLHGDWYWGAIAGKCALFGGVPLTALGLYTAGRRWFSETAGLLAAVVYVTTPWIDRVSIIGLSEGGMTYFVFATTFAAMLAVECLHAGRSPARWIFMTGLLAGSGMGCKYTGLMQLVIPAAIGLGIALVLSPRSKVQSPNSEEVQSQDHSKRPWSSDLGFWAKPLAIFAAGVVITVGPWLFKNLAFTGNPVYPLGYNIFGGRDWTPELNAKFVPAHSPKDHHPLDLGVKFIDVMADNDWSSPLVFGLAPLALFVARGRRISIALSLLVVYFIVTYWAFTHRIDRFWVPLVPVASLLAGVGATVSASRVWKWGAGLLIALAVWFNFGIVAGTPGFCGYNAMLSDRTAARRTAQNAADSFVEYLNETLPAGSKVLAVGDSQMFGARFPVVYNTVFNPSIFETWLAGQAPPGTKADDLPLKPPKEILDKLHAEGITHIYVDWNWIRRYREPGNYTFTDFVRPVRFQCLVRDGVLGTPVSLGSMSTKGMTDPEIDAYKASLPFRRQTTDGRTVLFTGRFGELPDQEAATLKELGPSLMTRSENRDVLINAQVFPVK
jgi:Dolichyl-phosphate-mannose-protein mannosyltransferase